MDGNGRWAKKRLLPRSLGHKAGYENMLGLIEAVFDRGVEFLTLYALSAENLSRPKEELDGLFSLFRSYFTGSVKRLAEKGVCLRMLGDAALLPEDIAQSIAEAVGRCKEGDRVLALAIGYSGRQEILRAVNAAVERGERVSEASFSSLLDTAGLPDPDLLIRTGDEKRLSNFLLWQCAYTELYFSDKMFPDFKEKDLDLAFESFAARDRRYGKIH